MFGEYLKFVFLVRKKSFPSEISSEMRMFQNSVLKQLVTVTNDSLALDEQPFLCRFVAVYLCFITIIAACANFSVVFLQIGYAIYKSIPY